MHAHFVPFTAQTRMSGVDVEGREIRKGAVDAVVAGSWRQGGRDRRPSCSAAPRRIAKGGGTPLAVAEDGRVLGSCISRTSSRAASASASPSCAGWASAR